MPARLSPSRRTQEQRSAETRARLIDATIDSLFELGYARTTTTEIAERAGLSRGAQLHHFPTKAELVITAVEHVFAQRDRELRAAFARLPAGADRPAAAIDLLWAALSGPIFYAWLELVVAARTDTALQRTVGAMSRRLVASMLGTFRALFPRAPADQAQVALSFGFALLQGLALDRIALGDDPDHLRPLDRLKDLARLVLA